ncbi:hypothetical protein Cni_G17951 [Canna indica]|uniref:HTH myb-type domain-containing protein n=1 Tax=Canna indica TaxID=4628 RepID=A0AAQ3KHZ3_9LILI|nr:hypothetical protein Cni_G17951 [Canna indica]
MAPDMASPAELTLDFKPSTAYCSTIQASSQGDEQNQKIHEFLARLEEERRKIEAFKRELPLCMQLLTNAIEIYKQQEEAFHQTSHGQRPVLEEFIPLKHMTIDGPADHKATSEKANWMTSAQLWAPAVVDAAKPLAAVPPKERAELGGCGGGGFDVVSPKLALDAKQRNGGAFLPFSKEKNKAVRAANSRALPELALASAPQKAIEEKKKRAELEVNGGIDYSGSRETSCTSGRGADHQHGKGSASEGQVATHRKARRCWSPDLHRRFVNALQILGGSQEHGTVATPKQIRELMKVDGLTNDEVKSHLQKYRLHTRRPAPAPQAAAVGPQLVVLGGIWMPPEYATTAAGAPAIYGAHAAAAAHYAPVPPEFYPPPLSVAAHHHLRAPLHLGAAAYRARPSPESEARSSGGERSESMEDTEEGEGRDEVEEEDAPGADETAAGSKAEDGDIALKF